MKPWSSSVYLNTLQSTIWAVIIAQSQQSLQNGVENDFTVSLGTFSWLAVFSDIAIAAQQIPLQGHCGGQIFPFSLKRWSQRTRNRTTNPMVWGSFQARSLFGSDLMTVPYTFPISPLLHILEVDLTPDITVFNSRFYRRTRSLHANVVYWEGSLIFSSLEWSPPTLSKIVMKLVIPGENWGL